MHILLQEQCFFICYWSFEKFLMNFVCVILRKVPKNGFLLFLGVWIWHRKNHYLFANCCLFRSKALSAVTRVEKWWVCLYLQLYASQGANMVNALGRTSVSATQDTLEKLAIKVRKNLFLKSWKYCYLSPHRHQCCVFPLCL